MHYDKLQPRDSVINAATDHWVGDPCYVVPEEYWGPLCDNWQSFEKKHDDNPDNTPLPRSYIAEVQDEEVGQCFHLWSTAYGDGCYPLSINGNKVADLGVDAGTLSVIPMSLIEHWNKKGIIGNYQDMGHVVKAEHLRGELICEDGDFFWGDLQLPTGYNAHEDEEEDPWMQEEQW